ncbi:phosphonates import ATP-binding protein PhnC [Desulfolithobacter dissulfuricans]|uniref:Phosphonates import ATP-binding protein PhnC n=1 Tax=Desulfolithobacter dissulfuricans TaxID=2795293 RepID=A0A915U454_9BACT|nr:phosphonate ABC transporter ATP-binding protein [Desulfolithobacter dissulfuricans]BCO10397.1 phosphonates import ATP-binding protein PhnC [Desulfolithobacter dissulfuricans]
MINLENVTLGYNGKPVLNNVNLHMEQGEFVGIIGLSGAGKSTLLMSLIGSIDILAGRYRVGEYQLGNISKKQLKELRSRIGFIFQGYNLVDRLSVLHNIMSGMLGRMPLPRALVKCYDRDSLARGYEYMQTVDLVDVAHQRCDALSGGQRQRVAIARALAQEPDILLADEPVAALDPRSATRVMDILNTINSRYGVTIIANLHHLSFAREYCSRIIGIAEGGIVFDGSPAELAQAHLDRIYHVTNSARPEENVAEVERSLPIGGASPCPRFNKNILIPVKEAAGI